jgi:energy-coupling factor transporter ATP-binding protein EcfA2
MDEPFAALDALTREQLYGDLQRIWKARRKTIVFVTHNVREAVYLGDRVLLFSPHPRRVQEEFIIELPRPRDLNSVELATYASELPTPSKAVPGPRLRQRHERIPPRCFFPRQRGPRRCFVGAFGIASRGRTTVEQVENSTISAT